MAFSCSSFKSNNSTKTFKSDVLISTLLLDKTATLSVKSFSCASESSGLEAIMDSIISFNRISSGLAVST